MAGNPVFGAVVWYAITVRTATDLGLATDPTRKGASTARIGKRETHRIR